MDRLQHLEADLEKLQRSTARLRRLLYGVVLCAFVCILMGAAATTKIKGDMSVGGVLDCAQLRVQDKSQITGDLTVGKAIKVADVDIMTEIASLKAADVQQAAQLTTIENTMKDRGKVAWLLRGGNPPTNAGDGSVVEFDFGKPVTEATAAVNHINLKYPGGDDHHIHRVFIAANVERIEGTKVFVRYRANFHDNGNNNSTEGGVEIIVVARLSDA